MMWKIHNSGLIYDCVTKHDADANDNICDCVVLHDTETNDNIHDCVALHDANTNDHFHWHPHESSAHSLFCCTVSHHPHTHRGSSVESFTPSTWSCPRERFSSPWLSLSAAQREWTLLTSSPSPKVKSQRPATWTRPQSSPTCSSWTPPLFSDKVSSADPDYDDAALEGMLHLAHRAQAYHSLREDLSVSLSSSMSDRTRRLVGVRTVRPVEQRSPEAQSFLYYKCC